MGQHVNTLKETVWDYVDAIIRKSSFGDDVRYIDWCFYESARRSAQDGRKRYIHKKQQGDETVCCVSLSGNPDD